MEDLQSGTLVWFRGTQDRNTGKLLSVGGHNPPDWFLACVYVKLIWDDTYTLLWADGTPVGLPFERDNLTVAFPAP